MLSDSIRVCGSADVVDAGFLVRFDMEVGLVLGMFWSLFLGVAVGASRDRYGQSS